MKADHPYAIVRIDSKEAKSLANIGWTVTDSRPGWLHMEPPLK